MTLVAIDGPGGSGKSTVAAALAARLGVDRLDTGAMYRAVALAALRRAISCDDADRLGELARDVVLDLGADRFGDTVLLDGEDVTLAIRHEDVDAVVSAIAAHPSVRRELVERQRAWVALRGSAVVEGRDITSVVLPDADVKVYLTADPAERARRRAGEMTARVHGDDRPEGANLAIDVSAVSAAIDRRDRLDSGRAESPLVVADGAVVVDSTGKSVDEVVDEVWSLL